LQREKYHIIIYTLYNFDAKSSDLKCVVVYYMAT